MTIELPEPKIPYIEKLRTPAAAPNLATPSQSYNPEPTTPGSQRQRSMRQNTLEFPESDPWASPALHQAHNHAIENNTRPTANGFTGHISSGINGSPNNRPTGHRTQTETHNAQIGQGAPDNRPPGSSGSGWGDGYGARGGEFDHGQAGLGGFGQSSDDQGDSRRNSFSRTLGGGRISASGPDDVITINMLPEKEGMFMFQHRNYEVKSVRRASSVIRRYSDFVWLVDCLQKRYPFRQIPLLPPKRIGGMLNWSSCQSFSSPKNAYGF